MVFAYVQKPSNLVLCGRGGWLFTLSGQFPKPAVLWKGLLYYWSRPFQRLETVEISCVVHLVAIAMGKPVFYGCNASSTCWTQKFRGHPGIANVLEIGM
ncbi:hypothetical protein RRG08_063895 [Elysia crispata]|uniref:Uncharacterized protein n=1 Tax=Elysia crispata TaxID=231223 RepID=A0AAE1B8U5_9GAST|nr:hypothetical protein RRG08_063895 [Elysia crispata]